MKKTILLAAITMLFSCSSDDSSGEYSISPSTVSLNYDKTESFTVKEDGSTISASEFTWSSSDTKRGTVNGSGFFTAKKVGTLEVTATRNGKTAKAKVIIEPYQTFFKEPLTYFGRTKAEVKAAEFRTLITETATTLMYKGENSNVLNVGYIFDNSGKMTSSGVHFPTTNTAIEKVTTFYKERYNLIDASSMPIMFSHLDEPMYIGLNVSSSGQFIATYVKP